VIAKHTNYTISIQDSRTRIFNKAQQDGPT